MRQVHHIDGDPYNNDPSNIRIIGNEEKNPAIPSGQPLKDNSLKATPWDLRQDMHTFEWVVRPEWSEEGTVPFVCTITGENAKVAGKLIAAAPALVAALKSMVAAHCPNDKVFCGSCSPARDVLSLVEGGQ